MKRSIIIAAWLVSSMTFAATNYVLFSKSKLVQGVATNYTYDASRNALHLDGLTAYKGTNKLFLGSMSMGTLDWTKHTFVSTTNAIPDPFVKPYQISYTVILPLSTNDVSDFDVVFDPNLKAAIKGLVKALNAKLPEQYNLTAEEVKAAIREELEK